MFQTTTKSWRFVVNKSIRLRMLEGIRLKKNKSKIAVYVTPLFTILPPPFIFFWNKSTMRDLLALDIQFCFLETTPTLGVRVEKNPSLGLRSSQLEGLIKKMGFGSGFGKMFGSVSRIRITRDIPGVLYL